MNIEIAKKIKYNCLIFKCGKRKYTEDICCYNCSSKNKCKDYCLNEPEKCGCSEKQYNGGII